VTIGSVGNSATLDLFGASRTINSLATAGTAANQKITNSSATAATMNYTGASTNSNFGGVVENGSGGSTTAVTLNAAGATLTLSGNNTYSGITTITAGTLEIASTGRLGGGSYSSNISNAGAFIYSGANDQTLSGVISGAGALTQNGTGALTLSGNNTFTGGVTLNQGTLNINFATALGNATIGAFVINGGTIDNTSAGTITVGAKPLTINGDFAYTGGSQSLNLGTGATTLGTAAGTSRTITVNANTLTIGGAIANGTTANSIIKAGAGTLTLSGANTFTGGVTLNAGTLSLGNATALGTGTLTINGGALDVTGAIANTTNNNAQNWNANFTFNGTNTLNLGTGAVTMNASRIVTVNASTLTVGGAIGDSGNAYGLTKAGAGNLTLTGANTYTGTTTINAGTLSIGNNGTTGNLSASSSIINNGTLTFNRTDTITQGADFGNVISGTGNLIKAASGNLILTGANTYNGSTTISAGTLQIGNGGNTGSLDANSAIINNGTLTFNRTDSLLFANAISGTGSLRQSGTGTLVLSGDNSYSGLTTVASGTLTLSGNNSAASGGVTNSAGGRLNISHVNALGSGTLTLGGSSTLDNTSGGALTNAGNNAIFFNTAWTFGGTDDLNLGTGNVTSDFNNIAITLNGSGKTLTLGGNWTNSGNNTVRYLRVSGAGNTLSMGGLALTSTGGVATVLSFSGNGNVNITGDITNGSGTAGSGLTLGKDGSNGNLFSGILTLSGNNTYTGSTTLSGGTLSISSDANLSGSNSTLVFDGGTLRITGSSLTSLNTTRTTTFTAGKAVGFNIADSANTFTVSQNLTQTTGTLTKSGAGTLRLTGNSTYTGNTTISAGTLQFGKTVSLYNGTTANWTASRISVASGGTLALNVGDTANGEFGTGNVTTLLTNLGGANGTSSAGFSSGSNIGFDTTNAGGSFTIANNMADSTGAGGGAIGLAKLGTGTLLLTGNNTYSGATSINAGTLEIGSAGRLGGGSYSGNITNNGTFIYSGSNSQTLSGVISGSGALTQNNSSSTLTLSGTNTYAGATTVNAGTLSVLGSVASSATTVNNGATLTGNGTTGAITIASGGRINPGVGVGTINTGGVTLNGGGVYNWQLWNAGGTAGSDWDLISSTGALTFGAGSNFTINLLTVSDQAGTAGAASGFVNSQNYSWRLAGFGSAISGFDPNFFTLNATGFQNSLSGSFSLNATGNFLNLLYTTTLTSYTYSAGTGSWSTTTNWTPNGTPTSGSALTINGTGGTSTNDLLSEVQSLNIASTAGSYTIAGSGNGSTITLSAGITNSSSNNQTISMGINLGADQTFQGDAGNLVLSGALGTSNRTLTLDGVGNVSITNTVSGSGNLTKTGAGTLTLAGSNTYTGATTINAGTLTLSGGLSGSSVTVNGTSAVLNQTSNGSIAGTGSTFTLTSRATSIAPKVHQRLGRTTTIATSR